MSAQWQRADGRLVLSIEADDILVNQDWLHAAVRDTSWSRGALEDVFAIGAGGELSSEEFAGRLREAMASQVRGQVNGTNLLSEISSDAPGLSDIVALFLPSESSFIAGAVRDLDAIASWPPDKLARTALSPLLGIEHRQEPVSQVPNIAAKPWPSPSPSSRPLSSTRSTLKHRSHGYLPRSRLTNSLASTSS